MDFDNLVNVEIKVKVSVKVSADKLIDLLLARGVKVLKFVEVALDVQTVRRDHVGLALY